MAYLDDNGNEIPGDFTPQGDITIGGGNGYSLQTQPTVGPTIGMAGNGQADTTLGGVGVRGGSTSIPVPAATGGGGISGVIARVRADMANQLAARTNTGVEPNLANAAKTATTTTGGGVQTAHGFLSAADQAQIDQMLGAVNSTDDKSYWYDLAAQHGGVDATGVDWLNDRIRHGDGSELVRNGSLSKFQDSVDPMNPGQFSYAPFTDQFTNPAFQAPTGVTEQNDPGFQARLQMGAKALQSSAAAKGTLLTGQTLSDLNDYAQNFASNEFGNVYNRALGEYNANSQNNWQQYNQKYQQYLNGYQQQLGQFNTNLGAGQQAFGDTLALSSQNFGQNQQNWQNQFNTAQLGLNAAQLAANAGTNFGTQQGGYLTNAGNAAAAGTIGAGNGAQSGYASLGNLANWASQNPFFQSPYLKQGANGPGSSNYLGYMGTNF